MQGDDEGGEYVRRRFGCGWRSKYRTLQMGSRRSEEEGCAEDWGRAECGERSEVLLGDVEPVAARALGHMEEVVLRRDEEDVRIWEIKGGYEEKYESARTSQGPRGPDSLRFPLKRPDIAHQLSVPPPNQPRPQPCPPPVQRKSLIPAPTTSLRPRMPRPARSNASESHLNSSHPRAFSATHAPS